MRNIVINNTEVLNALDEYKDFLMNNEIEKHLHLMAREQEGKGDYYTGNEFLQKIISQGENHKGFPDVMRSYTGLMPSKNKDDSETNVRTVKFTQASSKLNSRLMEELSARVNTLNTVYPPGGYISWHNNANAAGYNVLFTWSETGDGIFKYWDIEKQEIVEIPDVPGWQCKMGYFGPYFKPETLCYHSASTNCWRISVAYVFAEADNFWQEVIEDIENPL